MSKELEVAPRKNVSTKAKKPTQEIQQKGRNWERRDGVIYFEYISRGLTGGEWIQYFKKKGLKLEPWDIELLSEFDTPSTKGTKVKAAILPECLFEEKAHISDAIDASKLFNLVSANDDLSCHMWEMFSAADFENMGIESVQVSGRSHSECLMEVYKADHTKGKDRLRLHSHKLGHWMNYSPPGTSYAFGVSRWKSKFKGHQNK